MGAMEDVGKVISDASKTWTRQGQRQDMSKTPAETPVEGARKRIPASRSSAVHRALEANRRMRAPRVKGRPGIGRQVTGDR